MKYSINDMWSELIAVYEQYDMKTYTKRVDLDPSNSNEDIDTSLILRKLNNHFKGRLPEGDAKLWNRRICRALENRRGTMYRLERKRKEALKEKGQVEFEPGDIHKMLESGIDFNKTLDTIRSNDMGTEELKEKVSDVEIFGRPDAWVCICKASSKAGGWMKSTKATSVGTGVLVQVSTQQGYDVAEALTYVPGGDIRQDDEGHYFISVP